MNNDLEFPALVQLAQLAATDKPKRKRKARTEDSPTYDARPAQRTIGPDWMNLTAAERATIALAINILDAQLKHDPIALNSPRAVTDYLRMKLQGVPFEVFSCLWLDAQHRLIAYEQLFRGTLTQTSVYPREVVKGALEHNAAAVILTHNHPSGIAEASRADELLTQALKSALDLVDIKVLDHIIIADDKHWSFAEKGRL